MLTLAVPTELGGMGATIREVALVDRELARHCGSTALALSMHHHVTAFTAWRWRRDLPGAEATLQRVAGGETVLVSTGGGDFTHPAGTRRQGRRRLPGQRAQAVRQPVARRRRDVDDVHVRRPRARPAGAQHGRAVRRRRHGPRQLGRDGHARHGEQRRHDRRRVRARRARSSPTARTASSTRRCRSSCSIAFPIISAVYLGVAEAAAERGDRRRPRPGRRRRRRSARSA